MNKKKLIQVLLPLYDPEGKAFPGKLYAGVKKELTEKFGGLTIYTRAPATGLWKETEKKVTRDDIIIYEVVAKNADKTYWAAYKKSLADAFKQEELMIRCSDIELL